MIYLIFLSICCSYGGAWRKYGGAGRIYLKFVNLVQMSLTSPLNVSFSFLAFDQVIGQLKFAEDHLYSLVFMF